jgi:N-acetylglucosamine-6-phosphate deacetylase
MKCEDQIHSAPGFIDLQVNGFAGVDYNAPATPHDDIARSILAIFSTGVSRFFPTVITGSPERMGRALANLAAARESIPHGSAMAAFHVEGPWISPDDGPRGAHPRAWVRPPDLDEFHRLQESARGHIRLITISPHWPDAAPFIESLIAAGIVVSIGHTSATPQQIRDAASAGATLSTHLGNGAHPMLAKTSNYVFEQLADDRLSASFIADGIHLPDAFLKAAIRAKTIARSVLVTDAVSAAMCPPGDYELGDVLVTMKPDGRVVLRGGDRLAGSSLRMDRAIENAIRIAGVSLDDAIAMASKNPARLARIDAPRDSVKFRHIAGRVEIVETIFDGQPVFHGT